MSSRNHSAARGDHKKRAKLLSLNGKTPAGEVHDADQGYFRNLAIAAREVPVER